MIKHVYILFMVLLCYSVSTKAQQIVHKVSKQIHKEYTIGINELEIIGEKSSITVIGWDKNYIDVEMVLISRNTDKKSAINDINFIKIEDKKSESKLLLKNYFDGQAKKLSSNLSVEYRIKLPVNVSLKIMNLYGKVELSNLNTNLSASTSFGTIELNNIKGKTEIQNMYSNFTGNLISGSLKCISEKSDIKLTNITSSVLIESKYGEINLQLIDNSYPIELNCLRSEVNITIPRQAFNYQLNTLNSTIKVPGKEQIETDQYQFETSKNASTLNINTTYCPIIINYEKP